MVMRSARTIWIATFGLISFATTTSMATPTQSDWTVLHSQEVKVSYPETTDGLKAMVGELFTLEQAGDVTRSEAPYATLAIPDHKQWFEKTFGQAEGARLETKYVSSSEFRAGLIRRLVKRAVADKRTLLNVQVFQKPDDTSIVLAKAILSAMASPVTLYDAGNTTSPDDKSPFFFGYFVYVDGGFRYLDMNVMRALSTAPPMRTRVGGAVQHAKLRHSVQPDYPEEAKKAGIEGTVRLHVILTKEGGIEEIEVVSGQPLLAKAALDAVRLWRYEPTLLNGEPVEVDTMVDVNFQLKR
jgi:TonB family protein